jgi:alanine racemase
VPLRVAVSSGAIRLLDGMTLNGIDVGTLLFGLDPPNSSDLPGRERRDLGLRPALVRLVTRLSQVRDVRRDEFAAQSPIPTGRVVRLGVIPMGASDGFLGISTGEVLVGGRRGRVLSISLEHTRLDLTGIDARAGDEVVIIGRQGNDEISPREIAAAKGLYGTAQVPVQVTGAVARRYVGGESGGDPAG